MGESGGPAVEKPENGLAGLKHWRYDLPAGLLVSLISVPFSLGIAVSSGAPPISGLISAIIAGLVLPFLGGSYVTVSGPAAGLAPALFAAMILLGRGDRAVGYPLLLVAICLTGVLQVVLSRLKAARLSAVFPSVVVEAMLASIGLMIIVKQLPDLLGRKYVAHDFFGIIAETPARVGQMDGKVFGLAFACLALIFGLGMIKARWMKAVPPPVIVAFVGIATGRLVGIEPLYLVHIPDHPFAHGIVWPDFTGVWADTSLWYGVGITV
ncbi:MAG: SulP family inorganic anion transporter, partial [Planctomycetota bacterium]|nr:SulP family inorganic anion transporter [Planctomycetota bacterium]